MAHRDFDGTLTTPDDGEIGVSQGQSIESKVDFQRPMVVEAEMKTDGSSECISMTLFAPDSSKNEGISLEIGGWGTKWRFFPGDNQGEMGSVSSWRKVKLELDSSEGAHFYIDEVQKYSTNSSLKSGKLRFVAGCRSMRIRNIKIGK